ncbi:hypothetical protein [Telluribacter sp.]|jgi:hypothetical protein|uniref:hypothetical protein n=1 Tax=Telluribacter sp. TaxID=1978767 RepID=UPI002E12AFDB|nr:hypothetical protein [Telluribacter sp.]
MHRIIVAWSIALTLFSCRAAEVEEQYSLVGKWKYTAIQEQNADWKPVKGTYYETVVVEFTRDQKISYTINNVPATDPCQVPCSPRAYRLNKEDIAFTDWFSCPNIDCAPVSGWKILLLTNEVLEVARRDQPPHLLRLERVK